MSEKNEALRLAAVLDDPRMVVFFEQRFEAAAELRRLWAENEAIKAERDEDRRREYGYSQQVVDALTKERNVLRAQRDALLEALRTLFSYANTLEMRLLDADGERRAMQRARAAIKAVEEGK